MFMYGILLHTHTKKCMLQAQSQTHIHIHNHTNAQIVNYDEVRQAIVEKLEMLRDSPVRDEPPIIYHLDVGESCILMHTTYHMHHVLCTMYYVVWLCIDWLSS